MNVTFRLLTDFGGLPWCLFWLAVVFLSGVLYIGFRVVRAFEKWVMYYGHRKETSVFRPSGPTQSPSVQVGPVVPEVRKPTDLSVPQVDPAAILKRAPKSAGFGGAGDGSRKPDSAGGSGGDESAD